jgi:hypothetical protein
MDCLGNTCTNNLHEEDNDNYDDDDDDDNDDNMFGRTNQDKHDWQGKWKVWRIEEVDIRFCGETRGKETTLKTQAMAG